jgi:hypothetical protein
MPRRLTISDRLRRRTRLHKRKASGSIISFLFARKKGWTPVKAHAWLRGHGYASDSITYNEANVHGHQLDGKAFKRVTTKPFGEGTGVSARIGFR